MLYAGNLLKINLSKLNVKTNNIQFEPFFLIKPKTKTEFGFGIAPCFFPKEQIAKLLKISFIAQIQNRLKVAEEQ